MPRRLASGREIAECVIDWLDIVDPGVRVKFGVKTPEGVFFPLNQDAFRLTVEPGMFPMLILLGMVGAPPVATEDASGGIGGGRG